MTNTLIQTAALSICVGSLTGCERTAQDAPPEIHLDSSVCIECGMILSDERFVAATVVEDPRGQTEWLFDDYNCQVNFETAHPEHAVVERWAHDHTTSEWIRAEQAWFLYSENLRTPMASHAAAFRTKADAEAAQAQHEGSVLTLEALRETLSQN